MDDISLTSVTKIFHTGVIKRKTAVEDLTFSVQRGQVVGLLGANGSGKSTTLKMIMGFLRPTAGEITVCGHDSEDRIARTFIGYLPENPRFQKFLTARQVLHYYGRLVGLGTSELKQKTESLLKLVSLDVVSDERIQGFSKGMTQRLAIAQSLLNEPRILIFDEPMSGLDPLGRMEIRKLIQQVHEQYPTATIFFSTHILDDVEQLCSSVVLLRKGKLTKQCVIEDLLGHDCQRFTVVVRNLNPQMSQKYESRSQHSPIGISISFNGPDDLVSNLAELRKTGATVVGVTSQRRTLEEALFAEPLLPDNQIQNEATL